MANKSFDFGKLKRSFYPTNTARNTAIDTAKGSRAQQITNEINVNIEHFENNRDTDIRELTEEMLETAEEMKERDDRVYA